MNIEKEHKYIPSYSRPDTFTDQAWIIALAENKVLMKRTETEYSIPAYQDFKGILQDRGDLEFIGTYDGHDCYCKRIPETTVLPEHFEFVERRELTALTKEPGLFLLAGNANHILHWYSMNQFCGRCGHKTYSKEDERAKVCPACGNIIYPRISPATITAIFKDEQILLAHNRKFKEGLYSLVAGFVEAGETLEECVEREIMEEIGIKVKNVRYFTSQPWAFPDSLMFAFTAEYDSGEITVDGDEITDAGWYTADCLPDIPTRDSVAGKLIRWYRDKQ
ncbi:NAD(+) diphosphatase [Anaerocolumna jejuensis]|uniref:NAD(+) diphosphatase n=1 Tax=Anaerocolumna jejuensis TaxID=259063 RepID=UPI003F7C88C8